jgi:hypothetical protein
VLRVIADVLMEFLSRLSRLTHLIATVRESLRKANSRTILPLFSCPGNPGGKPAQQLTCSAGRRSGPIPSFTHAR